MLTVGSLFSSVGGLDLGLHRAGFRHVFFAEQDAYRRRVLARHWPGVPIYDDVRAVRREAEYDRKQRPQRVRSRGANTGHGLGAARSVGVLAGGFPCQDLSVAGRRRGLAGERSGLFFEFARIADALVPAGGWLLIENVPGLLSSNGGRDFAIVLATLADLGFHDLAWRVLDSRYFRVPQRRRRVFIVARRASGSSAAEVLLESSSLRGDSAAGGEAGEAVAATLTSGSHGNGVSAPGRRKEDDVNLVANTLKASGAGGGRTNDIEATYVAPAIVKRYGKGTDSDATDAMIVNALDTQSGGPDDNSAQAGHIIADPLVSRSSRGRPTPLAPGHNTDGHIVAHTLRAAGFDASEDGTGRGTPLTTFDAELSTHTVHGVENEVGALTKKLTKAATDGSTVRRLTPTECERLQGWPDGWTIVEGPSLADVPSWYDLSERDPTPHDPQPDSPRYAACGDGVTTTVGEWIGGRIRDRILAEGRIAA